MQAIELKKGMIFNQDGKLIEVLKSNHHKPGKGNTVMQMDLRDVMSGAVVHKTMRPSEIKTQLATYFMNSITNTQFIAKAKLIELLTTSIKQIKAIEMNIYSDMAEQAYYNSYYYRYSFRLINGSYEYVKEKVIYEKEDDKASISGVN